MNDKTTHANPSKNRTPRHRAREFALQGLYQWLLNNEDATTVVNNIRAAHGFEKADGDHFAQLLYGAIKDSVIPGLDLTIELWRSCWPVPKAQGPTAQLASPEVNSQIS